jgi:hypothetical protein
MNVDIISHFIMWLNFKIHNLQSKIQKLNASCGFSLKFGLCIVHFVLNQLKFIKINEPN